MTDKYCPLRFREYDSNPHDQRCIGEYCAWFDKCSESELEPIWATVQGETDVRTETATEELQEPRETAQDSNDVDTREKLEADVREFIYNRGWIDEDGYEETDTFIFRMFVEWLDRQAAITERTAVIAAKEAGKVLREKIAELQAKVDELTAECSECVYKQEFDNLDELERAMNEAAGKWAKADALADELREEAKELRAENTELIEENGDLQVRLDEANDQAYELLTKAKRLENERDYWKLHTDCWADKYKQRNEEANEYAEKLEELEKRLAGNARHPFAETILASLDSRENELKLQEKVEELGRENEKLKSELDARMYWVNLADRIDELEAENAKLSSDELHWRSEAKRLEGELKTQRNNFDQATGARDYWKEKLGILLKRLSDMGCKVGSINDVPIEVELPERDEGLA